MGKDKKDKVKKVKVRRHTSGKQARSQIRTFHLGQGLPTPSDIRDELQDMREVLLGHIDPPIEEGIMTMMEVADGYYARACDLEQQILRAQEEGRISGGNTKSNKYHSLRTQEIRSFKEMAKNAFELGSRRVTAANIRVQQEARGREAGY